MHIPVLKKEVLRYLDPKPGENFIDGTFGGGGHSLSILTKNAPDGKVLGIELDEELYKEFKNFDERLILQRGSYVDLKEIAENNSFFPDGVLLDVGMCSFHVDISKRGFSFLRDEPLDMRYDTNSEKKAADIINNYSLEDLKRIFINYG